MTLLEPAGARRGQLRRAGAADRAHPHKDRRQARADARPARRPGHTGPPRRRAADGPAIGWAASTGGSTAGSPLVCPHHPAIPLSSTSNPLPHTHTAPSSYQTDTSFPSPDPQAGADVVRAQGHGGVAISRPMMRKCSSLCHGARPPRQPQRPTGDRASPKWQPRCRPVQGSRTELGRELEQCGG
ncbi:MAG: hypothetical protein QOE28_2765 [Solirubrobacteraceae bacterium]|nr:hypothetical protein [Solirubrobacteraceae bacterium]